jgi:hypothetical protein
MSHIVRVFGSKTGGVLRLFAIGKPNSSFSMKIEWLPLVLSTWTCVLLGDSGERELLVEQSMLVDPGGGNSFLLDSSL